MNETFDDLTAFLHWWMQHKPISTLEHNSLSFVGGSAGVVLYRQDNYQVQLFIGQPNSTVKAHVHPNVDSYEIPISGELRYIFGGRGDELKVHELGSAARIYPNQWHGGNPGPNGVCIISVQKWLNEVPPTCIGNDWHDEENRIKGSVDEQEAKPAKSK